MPVFPGARNSSPYHITTGTSREDAFTQEETFGYVNRIRVCDGNGASTTVTIEYFDALNSVYVILAKGAAVSGAAAYEIVLEPLTLRQGDKICVTSSAAGQHVLIQMMVDGPREPAHEMVRLAYLVSEDIPLWSTRLLPFIEQACAAVITEMDPGSLLAEARDGGLRLWIAYSEDRPEDWLMVAGTRDGRLKGLRVVDVVFCAGRDMDRWLSPVMATFEAICRAEGITEIRLTGRSGWTRPMRAQGYAPIQVMMSKRLG